MSSDEETQNESPRIIVDDDWKEQVAKEKAAAAAAEASGTPPSSSSGSSIFTGADDATAESSSDQSLPPASFETLLSMMFTQGMAMLGMIPDPETGQPSVNKPLAKHTIDTLEVLAEKTEGNLTDDESKMLGEAMHALRMAYVGAQ